MAVAEGSTIFHLVAGVYCGADGGGRESPKRLRLPMPRPQQKTPELSLRGGDL